MKTTLKYAYGNRQHNLGIPWEAAKTIPFGPVVPYLGFSHKNCSGSS